jgi:hypothetical protein
VVARLGVLGAGIFEIAGGVTGLLGPSFFDSVYMASCQVVYYIGVVMLLQSDGGRSTLACDPRPRCEDGTLNFKGFFPACGETVLPSACCFDTRIASGACFLIFLSRLGSSHSPGHVFRFDPYSFPIPPKIP